MKIEVGKYYRTRNGRKIGPMELSDACGEGSSFFNSMVLYKADGTFEHNNEPCSGLDIIDEWIDEPETGTLDELNVQPGDVVECVDNAAAHESLTIGKKYIIGDRGRPIDDKGQQFQWSYSKFRIISRAIQSTTPDVATLDAGLTPTPPSPVRAVTRKEILPGVYGKVEIVQRKSGYQVCMFHTSSASELTAAIATLTEIRDALENP